MSLAACKVIINNGLLADTQSLGSRVSSFESLVRDPGFAKIPKPEREAFFQKALLLDNQAREVLQGLADEYDKLNLAVAEAID